MKEIQMAENSKNNGIFVLLNEETLKTLIVSKVSYKNLITAILYIQFQNH